MKFMGYIWAAATTALCLLFYLLPLWAAGRVRPVRWYSGGAWDWQATEGAPWAAVTLGWCILWYVPRIMPRSRNHEMRHVGQNMVFGPLFMPLYALGYLIGMFRGDSYWQNPFEVDARAHEGA